MLYFCCSYFSHDEISTHGFGQEGLYLSWHKNGKLSERQFFKSGKKHGFFKKWYPNGIIQQEGQYKEDSPFGRWNYYHDNGTIESTQFFNFKGLDGDFLISYDKNGQIRWKTAIKNGSLNGLHAIWYETGEKRAEVNLKNGVPHGPRVTFYKNGLIELKSMNENGLPVAGSNEYFNRKGEKVDLKTFLQEERIFNLSLQNHETVASIAAALGSASGAIPLASGTVPQGK